MQSHFQIPSQESLLIDHRVIHDGLFPIADTTNSPDDASRDESARQEGELQLEYTMRALGEGSATMGMVRIHPSVDINATVSHQGRSSKAITGLRE